MVFLPPIQIFTRFLPAPAAPHQFWLQCSCRFVAAPADPAPNILGLRKSRLIKKLLDFAVHDDLTARCPTWFRLRGKRGTHNAHIEDNGHGLLTADGGSPVALLSEIISTVVGGSLFLSPPVSRPSSQSVMLCKATLSMSAHQPRQAALHLAVDHIRNNAPKHSLSRSFHSSPS